MTVALVVTAGTLHGQEAQRVPAFRVDTRAVVVDVIVRDKKGNPVTGLQRNDFDLLEDSSPQEIEQVVEVRAALPGQNKREPEFQSSTNQSSIVDNNSKSETMPSFVALVFDRLSPEARELAYRSASAYIKEQQPNDRVGVFLSDLSLVTIQPYTSDRQMVLSALKDVASRATSGFARGSENAELSSRSTSDPRSRATDDLAGRAQMIWGALEQNQQGFASTDALMAVIGSLSSLPGRKTVVFFAESLALPDNVLPHFQNVVATANRGNVSVYPIDAAGLRVRSEQAAVAHEVIEAGKRSVDVAPDGGSYGSVGSMELVSSLMRGDPHTALQLLASGTGGMLIDGTNDLKKALSSIQTDRDSYYLLTYVPRNDDFRGEWRKLAVKVTRADVTVRCRSGYLALREADTLPVLSYEAPAVAALQRVPAPTELPIRAAVFQFPEPRGVTNLSILVATPAKTLRVESTADRFKADATLMARLTVAGGEVVRRDSEPVHLSGPSRDVARMQADTLMMVRHSELQPGNYMLEGVVYDDLTHHAGVVREPITIREASDPNDLRLSGLILVARVEPAAPQPKGDPLTVGNVRLIPLRDTQLSKAASPKMTFFYTVATSSPVNDKPTASLRILQGDREISNVPLVLPPADANGIIRHLARVPVDALPSGAYILRLQVERGSHSQSRETAFQIAP